LLDLKIVNGLVVDGSGGRPYRGALGVRDGRIAALGEVAEDARETLDADGQVVAPGFIDPHTHYDAQVFWDPMLSPSCFHGVTTVLGGFCGFSIAPLTAESAAYLMPMLARVEGMPLQTLKEAVPWNWASFGEYLGRLEGRLGVNAGFLAGHSPIRRYVMGPRATGERASAGEVSQMKALLRQCIREGALGFSTSFSPTHNDAEGHPVPSRHASREELLELFAVLPEFEGTIAEVAPPTHFSDEICDLLAAISAAAKRPLNWNALAVVTNHPEEQAHNAAKLRASDLATRQGGQVVALTLPNTPSVYMNLVTGYIFDAFPGWAPLFNLSIEARIERLRDAGYRAALKAGADSVTGEHKPVADYAALRVVEIVADENQGYKGRLVGDIAREEGRAPFDTFIDIALADGLATSFSPRMPEETPDIYRQRAKLWRDPRCVIGGSDAGAHLDMINTFAVPTHLLANGVRRHGVISLEEAVEALTRKPAELMGLKDRGMLRPGWCADIVVFDPKTVDPGQEYTRYDLPAGGRRLYSEAQGISHVIVNGCEILRHGEALGARPGAVLRSGRDTYSVTPVAVSER
jgi:N-acyl-D-aspartate/D-glutamate deacylase